MCADSVTNAKKTQNVGQKQIGYIFLFQFIKIVGGGTEKKPFNKNGKGCQLDGGGPVSNRPSTYMGGLVMMDIHPGKLRP